MIDLTIARLNIFRLTFSSFAALTMYRFIRISVYLIHVSS